MHPSVQEQLLTLPPIPLSVAAREAPSLLCWVVQAMQHGYLACELVQSSHEADAEVATSL